jgi:hypothetical protein
MAGETWGFKGIFERALELPNGSMVGVSPSGRARIRYNDTLGDVEISVNGSAYTSWSNAGPWTRVGTVVRLDYIGDTVVMGALTASGTEKLRVVGATRLEGDLLVTGVVDPSLRIEEQGSDGAFLGLGPGDTAAVSPAGGMRFRYNSTSGRLEISVNGGAYGPLTVSGWTDDGTVVRLTAVGDTVAIGAAAMAGGEKLRLVGDGRIEGNATITGSLVPDAAIRDAAGSTASLSFGTGVSAAVSAASEAKIRYNVAANSMELSRNAGSYQPIGGGQQVDVSFSFRSVFSGAGTVYFGGFYEFGGSANDFNPVLNFGSANNAYGAHVFIVAGPVSGTATTVRVTGTSITDLGVRNAGDTEDMVLASGDPQGTYKETTKKFLGQVAILKTAGNDRLCNYGWCKYWDNQNRDFILTAYEFTWWGGATDAGADLLLYHHNATGWTYNAGAAPAPPTPVGQMSTVYVTERAVTNNVPGAFKRVGLLIAINGDDSEGIIAAAVQSTNRPFDVGTLIVSVESVA